MKIDMINLRKFSFRHTKERGEKINFSTIMHKKKRNLFKERMRGINIPLSHKVAKSVCMPLNHIFKASADILSSFFL